MPESIALNQDCLEYMRTLPDGYFDLCVADPPYGAGFTEGGGCQGWFSKYHQDSQAQSRPMDHLHSSRRADEKEREKQAEAAYWNRFGQRLDRYKHQPDPNDDTGKKKIITWDVAPTKDVFDEMFRVSRNQIIWGGNYFDLPPTRCFLIWRKLSISESFTMAMAEYAWTSFNGNAKVFEAAPQGKADDPRFHPTQKPIELYAWIYKLFCKPGDKVFDPYLGSGSSRIAAWNAGLDFTGCEIDPIYFEKQEERFALQTAQMNLFVGE